ncbi:MAG: glycine/betaine/sarcosine/D-proline family reductase selenoprotein B [Actinomycetota bacterium]|nr:glycine/betaine/sarcosine/D-proline family reductase selenoprotein B [Actinomycetota bacterium]
MARIVHYVNQFFAGIGGEDQAGAGPVLLDGPVGPGKRLAELVAPEHEIVATVWCGDDVAPGMVEEIVALVRSVDPDLVVAGPAFTSGRYGLACARVVAAAHGAGLAGVASMHEDNPGLDEAGAVPVIASGEVARRMAPSLDRLAAGIRRLLAGETLTADDGRIGKLARLTVVTEANAAARSVDLALVRLGGDGAATEIPLPRFDRVTPAAPVADASAVTLALVTEGGLVAGDNPDGLESARATKWLRYPLEGREALASGDYMSVHGGFSTVWANEDPHRILPLDAARELEAEGAFGRLLGEYFVTTGNGTSVANARRFGIEWAGDLRNSGARAAILTAT